jgi:glutaredoxin 3
MPKQITIYTTQYCPHCRRAKALLERKKIPFREVDLTSDQAKRDELEKKTGWMTVPMIYAGEEFIGGADDLYALDVSGQLEAKLK